MPYLWIAVVVLVVSVPVLVGLLKGVVTAARTVEQRVGTIAGVASAASKDLDAVYALLTTQSQIDRVVAGLANYGGSLDVALPNA